MRNPALIFKDFGDGGAVAVWDDRNIGMIVPYPARPGRFAWSFAEHPMIISFRVASDSASARAALTRHFLEWLYATTTKELTEKVGRVA